MSKHSPQTKSHLPSIFVNRFYWNTATPIHLSMVCGYFQVTMAGLNSCDRDCEADAESMDYIALHRKKVY